MKKFWLDFVNKILFDAKIRKDMSEIVSMCESTGLSGKEKRAQAMDMIGKIGFTVGGYLLELAFMLAVASLKMGTK